MTDFYRDTLWPLAAGSRYGYAIEAAEEVLRGLLGAGRVVPAGIIDRGAYAGSSDEKLGADVLVKVRAEVVVVESARSPAIGPETATQFVQEVTFAIRFAFSTPMEIEADLRRAARAAALLVSEDAIDALAYAGNLSTTVAGNATSLVGGAFIRKGPTRVVREDWAARLFVVETLMTGLFNRTP